MWLGTCPRGQPGLFYYEPVDFFAKFRLANWAQAEEKLEGKVKVVQTLPQGVRRENLLRLIMSQRFEKEYRDDLVAVFTSKNLWEAEFYRSLLEEHDIPAVVQEDYISADGDQKTHVIGVLVPEDHLAEAQDIIEQQRAVDDDFDTDSEDDYDDEDKDEEKDGFQKVDPHFSEVEVKEDEEDGDEDFGP